MDRMSWNQCVQTAQVLKFVFTKRGGFSVVKNVRESTLSLKAGKLQQFIDFQRNVFYQDKDNTKLRSEQSQMMSIRR